MANEQRLWYSVNLAPKSQWPFTLHKYGRFKGMAELFHAEDQLFLKDIKT